MVIFSHAARENVNIYLKKSIISWDCMGGKNPESKNCKSNFCCWPGSRPNINFVSSAMKEKINISTSRYVFTFAQIRRVLLAGKNMWCNFWCGCFHKAAGGKKEHPVSVLSGCSDLIDWSFFTAEILELHDMLSNLLALVIWPRVFQCRTTGLNSQDIVMKVVKNSTIFQISQKKMLKNVAF